MFMITPRMTKIVINGILFSLFLSKNKITSDNIVRPKVRMLNFSNVCLITLSGFVRALEFAAAKKAGMFSIDKGKNYVFRYLP